MKDSTEILHRARACVWDELNKRLMESSRRLPVLCQHNHRQPLDTRKLINGEPNEHYNRVTTEHTIGLCMYGVVDGTWMGTVCEDPIDAQRCPLFDPLRSKESIIATFRGDLQNPEWVSSNMPELASLLWVLDEEAPPRLSLWQRVVLFFRRWRLEPLQPYTDPVRLLEPPDGDL